MSKPRKTAADYMVIAISPALIMALVGSLCFFLVEVFYRGQMFGGVCWVLFWFILGIVLVGRIGIESGKQHAALYGFGLAFATWIFMMRTQPAYLLGMVLLAIVWFLAHKLVWDCTLIDEDQDSSGQGLLQKSAAPVAPIAPAAAKGKTAIKKPARKIVPPQNPGRWVIYFSLAALPLFGLGQMALPGDATTARRNGLIFLASYLGAALGLLVTTSFLGLRRYLRQRYLKMPPSIAFAWLKFGIGVALFVLIGAVFLPRPGVSQAWAALSYQINYQLSQASQYASPHAPPGLGQGNPGRQPGGKQGEAPKNSQEQANNPPAGQNNAGETQNPSNPSPAVPAGPTGNVYLLMRAAFWIVVVVVVGGWIIRNRALLLEIARSIIAAIDQFYKWFVHLVPRRMPVKESMPVLTRPRLSSFAEYKNPFFTDKEHAWPPEQIIVYSYEAVQVWAMEHGATARPEETAREFCGRLGGQYPEFNAQFNHLARLYAYAAYGLRLPPESDLEPVRELWRHLPPATRVAA